MPITEGKAGLGKLTSFWMQHRSFKRRDATAKLKYICRAPNTHPVAYLRWTESMNNHLTGPTTHQSGWLVCTKIAHPRHMTHKRHVLQTLQVTLQLLKMQILLHPCTTSMHTHQLGFLKRSTSTESGRFIIWHHTLHYIVHVTAGNYFSNNVHLQNM